MGCFIFLFALVSPRLALFFVWMISVAILYLVLGGMGVWSKLNSNVGDLLTNAGGTGGELVSAGTIFGGALRVRIPAHAPGFSPAAAAVAMTAPNMANLARIAIGRAPEPDPIPVPAP